MGVVHALLMNGTLHACEARVHDGGADVAEEEQRRDDRAGRVSVCRHLLSCRLQHTQDGDQLAVEGA